MKIKFALIIFIVLALGSPSHAGAEDKVLDVRGKAVVFFGPTQKEYKSLSENEQNEWNEVLSDFYHYRDKTIPYLESNRIKPIITADAKIMIHTGANVRTFARKNFKHIVGYILTDGNNEPKVVEGVGTDLDLINDFKIYFKLE
jgi:hypothetical protein